MAQFDLKWTIVTPSGEAVTVKSLTAEAYTELPSVSIADGQIDKEVVFAVDVSQVVAFEIVSSQNVTVETNSGSSPSNSLSLIANIPYRWCTNWYDTFKLTVDVVAMYVTNASGTAATLQIRCLYDSTP